MLYISLYPLRQQLILKKIFGYLAGDVNAADQDYSYRSPAARLLSGKQTAWLKT
ncbi:MAG: hypothetical protein E6559_18665 [Pantoea sp.]|uniref:hypothetical protein n=1 Tax=Pantoea septica TaxID=472695 RepID=UPI001C0F825F|nr:hypothetical protein [Pantoea septica]MBU5378500.1 hypothetical protein [Pantoea septica]MDU6441886.1 hypothetical protein [Pantoea sp.]